MIQQKLTKTETKMILITKTLIIFPLWKTFHFWQSKSNQAKAMQLLQHWWSDRSEATFISISLTSTHVRSLAVPLNSGIRKNSQTFTQFWRWLLKIWFLLRRRKHLWKDCFQSADADSRQTQLNV